MAKKNRHRSRFRYDLIKKQNKGIPLSHDDEEKRAWEKLVGKEYVKGEKHGG